MKEIFPNQRVKWTDKIKKDHEFFKRSADFFISQAGSQGNFFNLNTSGNSKLSTSESIQVLRDVYASIFPAHWFTHVTAPYKEIEKDSVRWGAKIRPLNIIKPNIDYVRGEYPKRPFPVMTSIRGEEGYDAYIEDLGDAVFKNAAQMFINEVNSLGEGEFDTGVESKEVKDPAEVSEEFPTTYKNRIAVQADTDLELIKETQDVNEKLEEQFEDFLVVGAAASYKDVIRDEVVYENVPIEELKVGMSPGTKYLKDAAWVVRTRRSLIIDIKDTFYDALTEKDLKALESGSESDDSGNSLTTEKNWYHVTWRSEEKIGILYYTNPVTGELEMDEVSEEYIPDEELGESVQWYWRSVWLECYRIGDGADAIYVEPGKVRYSPNYINNLAKTEGPYNGIVFSRKSTTNTSILKMQIPFLISYIIAHFSLERIISKGGNKIVLIDKNVIPKTGGWTDAKFFQFSEAKGWATIDRNQVGADKSFNQYATLDTSMYEYVDYLIRVMEFAQLQADTQIGLSRQRKAQITERDSVSGTDAAIFQSSIITEMIFSDFEKYKLTEFQGLLHCSQLANINGKKTLYTSSEERTLVLDINPEEYCYADLGILAISNPLENDALTKMRNYGQALAQNGVEASTLLEMETARSIPKLRKLLKEAEAARQKAEAAIAEREAEYRKEEISLEQQFQEMLSANDIFEMHEEYDRKEDLVMLQGDINMAIAGVSGTGNESVDAYMKYKTESDKIELENRAKSEDRKAKIEDMRRNTRIKEDNAKLDRSIKKRESAERIKQMRKQHKPTGKQKN